MQHILYLYITYIYMYLYMSPSIDEWHKFYQVLRDQNVIVMQLRINVSNDKLNHKKYKRGTASYQ